MVSFGELFKEGISKKQIEKNEVVTFLGMQDISEDAKVIQQHLVPFSEIRSGFTYFEKNDVLLAKITPCFENGKDALLDDLKTPVGFGSTEFHVLRAREGVDPRYIFHWTCTDAFRQRLEREMVGSAGHRRVPISEIRNYQLPIKHSETEQSAIANALSDADALIGSLQKLIAKKCQIKQGAMQTLLNPYENGVLKTDWEIKSLGDVLEKIVGGGTPSRSNPLYWGTEIPWITVKDFATHNPYSAQEYVTKVGLKNSASHLIPKDTLITSTRMALGKAVRYKVDVCINQDLKAMFPVKSVDTKYLFYWFQFNENKIAELGSGSTVMGISLVDLKRIPFPKPPLAMQTYIATVLSDMDAEISCLETKLAKYQQIKQGMMQNLLTGRIRLV